MSLERRIENLEKSTGAGKRQPRHTLVMLDENGKPVTERDAEVLHLAQEAEARGDEVRLVVFKLPAGTKIRQ